MSIEITLAGRRDIEAYFAKSGIRSTRKLEHHPLLIFIEKEGKVRVEIVDSASRLLDYPNETPVMGQWPGQWRSDFFQFTVGEFRDFVTKNLKDGYQFI